MDEIQKNEAIEELKYKLILVKNCDDDPLIQIKLIQKLKETYVKYGIDISDKVGTFIKEKVRTIEKQLKQDYEEKVEEYEKLRKKHDKKQLEHKRVDIFGW